ncbi:MAG: Copper chaperone PCu(A)C [Frankiaceae bacterium]|nr:Copper chaperone PCu(A)C [Frankiaceae bacterium]
MGPIRTLVVAAVAAGSLSGCAAGLHDETSSERSTPYVGGAVVGGLKIRDVAVIASAGTSGATPASSPSPGDTGTTQGSLTMVIVNDGTSPDNITGVQVGDGGSVTPTNPDASGTVNPGQSLIFGGGAAAGSTGPANDLSISGLAAPLVPGTTVKVTVAFQNAGDVVLQVPVLSGPAA